MCLHWIRVLQLEHFVEDVLGSFELSVELGPGKGKIPQPEEDADKCKKKFVFEKSEIRSHQHGDDHPKVNEEHRAREQAEGDEENTAGRGAFHPAFDQRQEGIGFVIL
jgi:hypothetical protein